MLPQFDQLIRGGSETDSPARDEFVAERKRLVATAASYPGWS